MDQPDLSPALERWWRIERASLSELQQLQDGYTSGAKSLKAKADAVKAEIARRYAESANQALAQAGKTHGSGKLQLQDRFAAKYDVKQEVKWDSAALLSIAQTLPWDRVQALFKIEFSMSETIYKGIAAAAPELRERIDAARTTTIKPPAITLVREEA